MTDTFVHEPPKRVPVRQGTGGTARDLMRAGFGSFLVLLGLSRRSLPGLAIAAVGGGLVYSARRRRHVPQRGELGVQAVATITIEASARELYDRWSDLERLPGLLTHVQAVEDLGNGRSHWRVDGPVRTLQWDAEITADEPGRRLAWRSLPEGDLDQQGEIFFHEAPGNRGTEVTVLMRYAPPGGRFGAAVAGLLGLDPNQTLREDLRRLKQLVETGEIATTAHQPAGRGDRRGSAGRLAQRSADAVKVFNRPQGAQEIR